MPTIRIQALAQWVSSVVSISPQVQQAAVNVVADTVAAAVAGRGLTGAVAARNAALKLWGDGPSTIWFTSKKGSLSAASFANAIPTSILDLDDGHRAAAGHPGAAIIPAVLAAAESLGVTGEKALIAIAIGYEVGIRIAASRDVRRSCPGSPALRS